MASSRRKNGGATRGRFKPKKMGKGYLSNRKQPVGSRPVLRITEVADDSAKSGEKA
ncbi:MAG: hypothetical protein H6838_05035 [Planctomycetes bacterium]|nr:hypothetical protein [Planctomycetota bacterium]